MLCVNGHMFDGSEVTACPMCSEPSQDLLKTVRKKAAKNLWWAVPYAVVPPAIAFWIGAMGGISDKGDRGIVVVMLMVFWIAGFFAMIGIVWDLIHPITEARAMTRAQQPPAA